MVEIADIDDWESLEAWLSERGSQQDSVWITSRAAARVLPGFWRWSLEEVARHRDVAALPVLRCLLISTVASIVPTDDIKSAAYAAADTAYAAAADTAYAAAANTAYDTAADTARASADAARGAAAAAAAARGTAAAARAAADTALATSIYAARAARTAAAAAIWQILRRDCQYLEAQSGGAKPALWHENKGELFELWAEVKGVFAQRDAADQANWRFWIDWYDDLLNGTPLNWPLLEQIALIPPEIWEDKEDAPAAVAEEIERLRDELQANQNDLQADLATLPAPKPETIAQVKAAMEQNRKELPPTFDAIQSLILLEIERLQKKNYRDEEDRVESIHQIRVYLTLYEAVTELQSRIPDSGPITDSQAAESIGLITLYKQKFAALPRDKADEVVEGVWETGKGAVQCGLVTGSAYLATLYNLSPAIGLSIGALMFAPKKAGDILKGAKDLLPKISP